ncbi:DUF3969 family protein [Deinococcus taeanensis]|uniref:DUF3969 family protein n=1 Tax=Deinococcus taeanensis TaxID=2737050 RepID=UPI001CDCA917|nr:DUF3969 family protein [Deinococcus taeanensis]UBV42098.1 DUF3969 family protein [Deinococcus taeanensis]
MDVVWIEWDDQNLERLERRVLITALGLLHSLEEGICAPDDVEAILFKPAVHLGLQECGVAEPILDLIQQGFFLDDIRQHRGPEALKVKISHMQHLATGLLTAYPDHRVD